MSTVSIVLMVLSLGGIWGGMIYYLMRLLKTQKGLMEKSSKE